MTVLGRGVLALACLLQASASGPREDVVEYADRLGAATLPLLIAGDFQQTNFFEFVAGREQNDVPRARLIGAIAAERAAGLVCLGDLVFDGASRADWAWFDRLMAPVHRRGTPVLPVLGNHDYWGSDAAAIANVESRFPQLRSSHWYRRVFGSMAIVVLDSNEASLGPTLWERQARWFETTLADLDADRRVGGVIVCAHHPPYTNSATTGDEAHVQRTFVETFLAARKTVAFFSGHAHTYERFEKRGKTFVVSGGGGAPRVVARAVCAHEDRCRLPHPRPFHYLRLAVGRAGVTVDAIGFDPGRELRRFDRFHLPFAPRE